MALEYSACCFFLDTRQYIKRSERLQPSTSRSPSFDRFFPLESHTPRTPLSRKDHRHCESTTEVLRPGFRAFIPKTMLQQPAIHPPGPPPMTSASTQRPTGNMTTGTRNRFSNIAMGNGTERPSQPPGSVFPTTSTWQGGGIWGNGTIGPFGKPREPIGIKYSSEAFSKAPSGSGALAATSEAEPWGNRSGWNTTEGTQNRNVSGNTSPNRSRLEAPIHDLNNNSTYYPSSQSQIQPASHWPACTCQAEDGHNIGRTSQHFQHQSVGRLHGRQRGCLGLRGLEVHHRTDWAQWVCHLQAAITGCFIPRHRWELYA